MKNLNRSFLKLTLAGALSVSVAGQALAAAVDFKADDSNGDGQAPAFHEGNINQDDSLDQDEFVETRVANDRPRAGKYVDDAWITAKVKTMLLKDESVNGLDLNVKTRKGTVQLAGWVNNPMQIAQAEKIARGVEGVTGVKNDLQDEH